MSEPFIISVQFESVGKNYYFDASRYPDLQPGDPIVVRTSRGLQLANITQINLAVDDLELNGFKAIERPATPQDLLQRKTLAIREQEIVEEIRAHLAGHGLSAVKVLSAEFTLDGDRLYVLINIEPAVTVNAKRLQQDIKQMVKGVEVDLRQIGPRDAAKLIGGLGACGLELRCCSKFLTEFASISIRMSKAQDISLTPSEITGMCGRLRCCLIYEYDQYVEAIKTLPKRKRKVITPAGEGKVVQILPLRQSVIVDIPQIGPREFSKEALDRAQRIADGQEVEPLPEELPQEEPVSIWLEDQAVENEAPEAKRSDIKSGSRQRRGRKARRVGGQKK
ncbi:MAG: regulatory iron-sulfur-containing complex subunit RicT [Anaerolineaceae bacterium]